MRERRVRFDVVAFRRDIDAKFGGVRQFAKVAGVAESTIYRAGTENLKPYKLQRLAAILGKTVEDYLIPIDESA